MIPNLPKIQQGKFKKKRGKKNCCLVGEKMWGKKGDGFP